MFLTDICFCFHLQLMRPMAFRVRVLHSLLLGLAGFSLVLCSFFYATPVALHYGDPASAPAATAAIIGIGETVSTSAANVHVSPTRPPPSASAAGETCSQ